MNVHNLEMLRPLGKMEQFSSARHHLGFYNNVGISANYKLPAASTVHDLHNVIYAAVADVINIHPILSAIPINEDTPNPYFARLSSIDLNHCIFFPTRTQYFPDLNGEDEELNTLLQNQHNTNFKSEYGSIPFWRLIILQTPGTDAEFTACFIFHHALGDGASGLIFHKSLLAALNTVSTATISQKSNPVVTPPTTPLLPPLEGLHPLPTPTITNKSSITTATTPDEEWTGAPIYLPCKTRFKSLSLSPETSLRFIDLCKEHGVTVTSALPALIASILFDILPTPTMALTCVIPVSLRRWLPPHITNDAMGTWIDAFSVPFSRTAQGENTINVTHLTGPIDEEIWTQALLCKEAIKSYLSHSGSAINVARFKNITDISVIFSSKVGKARDSAFEVSNLGVFDSPASPEGEGWQVGKIVFSRSAFASGSAVSVGVVSGSDGGMCLGFTWQDGVVEEFIVEELINGLKLHFQ